MHALRSSCSTILPLTFSQCVNSSARRRSQYPLDVCRFTSKTIILTIFAGSAGRGASDENHRANMRRDTGGNTADLATSSSSRVPRVSGSRIPYFVARTCGFSRPYLAVSQLEEEVEVDRRDPVVHSRILYLKSSSQVLSSSATVRIV